MMTRLTPVCVLTVCGLIASSRADDWPQWRGPHRTGISQETGLLKEWPKGGPKLLWERKGIGGGYSTPAIVGDRIYLMANREGKEYVVALAVKDGSQDWATAIGKVGRNEGPQYPGTRSTPTVEGDCIYALGSDGDLACLEKDMGKILWSKNLKKAFDGIPGAWAYSESVLIDGDKLICTPGGKKATMVALKKTNGETIWQCALPKGDAAGYASPIAVEVGGIRQYVQFVAGGVIGVDAKTGKFLWRYNKTKDPAANIPTPVFHDGCVFTSTSRNGTGLNRIKVSADAVGSEQVYFNTIKLNSIGGVVRVGDYVYGTDARGELVCVDFKTGELKWQHASVGSAALCYADGMLYVRGQGGSGFGKESPALVALVEATPDGYKEKGRFEQPDHGDRPAWPHPVVANGRLYLRDGTVLLCYDVKAKK
ncbi:MAG TPA: PQQ-binding-like beta-propeller repeat protein [Gemmataceae bacterium]|jgi:outer membrane protein assembly factor BamB